MQIRKWLLSAFDANTQGGMSARKASAFWIVVLITICHTKWLMAEFKNQGDFSLLPEVLIIDFSFVCIALGLTTFEQIIKLKNGSKDEAPTSNPPAA